MKRIMFLFSLFFSVILLAQEKLSVKYEYHLEMEFDEFMKDRGQMRLPPRNAEKGIGIDNGTPLLYFAFVSR